MGGDDSNGELVIILYRKRLKQNYKFSIKTVWTVIIAMTSNVEKILSAEMKEAGKGAIVHDAWS